MPEPNSTLPTFDQVFSEEALTASFSRFKDSHLDVFTGVPRVARGWDAKKLALFETQLRMELATISRQALRGSYTFRPFLTFEIPKTRQPGRPPEMRTIAVATIKDTLAQRALYDFLYPRVERLLTPAAFGYRRDHSTHGAIAALEAHLHAGSVFVLDADITSFFDRVVHDKLLEKVAALDDGRVDPRTVALVRRFLKTPSTARLEGGGGGTYPTATRPIGLPQGGVLSGLLSNLYLVELDRALEKEGQAYVRYADDFVVCSRSEQDRSKVREVVERELGRVGLGLHPEKTRELNAGVESVNFLGFATGPHALRVKGANIAKFKARVCADLEAVAQGGLRSWPRTLRDVIFRLRLRIRGPKDEDLYCLDDVGRAARRFHRSWMGFYRIVEDDRQLRCLDHWIRSQISLFMWKHHRKKMTLGLMQRAGLPTLLGVKYRARRSKLVRRPAQASVQDTA